MNNGPQPVAWRCEECRKFQRSDSAPNKVLVLDTDLSTSFLFSHDSAFQMEFHRRWLVVCLKCRIDITGEGYRIERGT